MSGRDGTRVDNAGGDSTKGCESTGDAFEVPHGPREDFDDEAVRTRDVMGLDDLRQRVHEIVERLVVACGVGQTREGSDVVSRASGSTVIE